jgi:hypothetical protein
MIIVDPVVLGDVPFTRASPKWVYDRTGTLVQVPTNTLGVTYDPADLSKAPWALLEPAAMNYVNNSTMTGASVGAPGAWPTGWSGAADVNGVKRSIVGVGIENGIEYIDVAFSGTATAYAGFYPNIGSAVAVPGRWCLSVFALRLSGSAPSVLGLVVSGRKADGSAAEDSLLAEVGTTAPLRAADVVATIDLASPQSVSVLAFFNIGFNAGTVANCTIRIGLPQLERDRVTSRIKTNGSAVTRAADVVGAGAGLVYSNVPMVEPPYNVATTYAKDAAVYDPATKLVYWSMVAGNVGKALSDPAFWNKRTAINRWAMFDDRNSTQTSNPEEIVSVFSAQAITQGLFAGAMDASEVRVSMTHPTRGLVYSETKSLVLPRSGSSFFGWCFNRLRLRTWFLTLKLPVFANALVTVTIKKPGGVPKCGMCLLGPTIDVGLSLMGLSTELKDYSTTTFFTDGSSSTVERGFSKKMSVDIVVERDRVETIEDDLIKRRQKTLVFLGSTMRGDTMLVGRFSSLRKVIDSYPRSKMALQIDGVLSQ